MLLASRRVQSFDRLTLPLAGGLGGLAAGGICAALFGSGFAAVNGLLIADFGAATALATVAMARRSLPRRCAVGWLGVRARRVRNRLDVLLDTVEHAVQAEVERLVH